ncbi:unnamed protein product [Rotaria sp. Silwood2]|nr:unnamed protein product [Rotaria sp. Silwood2]CAF3045750.1 unnamed protein product [Rotaria sp. Silwood2]CAF4484528.1 unnamed protein product [Rotaria sp. Silwood2]
MWAPLFFLIFIVISPFCTTVWNFNQLLCGFPCYYGEKILNKFDFIFNLLLPVVIIMLANVTLVIRVICRKISRQQVVNWRRHGKMVLQLWIISSLYMGLWLPLTITLFVQMTVLPSFMVHQMETLQFTPYFVALLLPMICLSTQPELVRKIKNHIRIRPVNKVTVITYNRNAGQTLTFAHAR